MSDLIPKHGGYRKLKSFQVAQLVYDVTVRFCYKHIDRRSRTHEEKPKTMIAPAIPTIERSVICSVRV